MEAHARDAATLAPAALMRLNFALGKAYDDLGRFGDALRCMNAGNALKRQRINYDEASMSDQFGPRTTASSWARSRAVCRPICRCSCSACRARALL